MATKRKVPDDNDVDGSNESLPRKKARAKTPSDEKPAAKKPTAKKLAAKKTAQTASAPPIAQASAEPAAKDGVQGGRAISQDSEAQPKGLTAATPSTREGPDLSNCRVLKTWPDVSRKTSRGMRNPGNYCYRNAAYQAILHCPEVVSFLDLCSEHCAQGAVQLDKEDAGNMCAICAFRRVAFAYWERGQYFQNKVDNFNDCLNAYLVSLDARMKWDSIGQQQDSAEFMGHMINRLRQDGERHTASDLLQQLFITRLGATRECQNKACGHSWTPEDSITYEPALRGISDKDDSESLVLEDLVNDSLKTEYIGMRCEKCESTVVWDIKRIMQAPEVLLIIVTPAWYPKGLGKPLRRKNPCIYPEMLDISGHAPQGVQIPTYTLKAVVAHLGPNNSTGHYTTVVREPNDEVSTANDESISRLPRTRQHLGLQRLLHPVRGGRGRAKRLLPVLLVYCKGGFEAEKPA